MTQSQAMATIPQLPPELQADPVNKAAKATATGGSKFQKGQRARQNGMVYEYDGQTWNPVGE
jgi:hypothetical protein